MASITSPATQLTCVSLHAACDGRAVVPPRAATKVVATVGPAIQEVDTLCELLNAGMIGVRVDLTWGPLDYHRKSLANVQLATRKARRLCCTMVDTLGRELMIRRQVRARPPCTARRSVHACVLCAGLASPCWPCSRLARRAGRIMPHGG